MMVEVERGGGRVREWTLDQREDDEVANLLTLLSSLLLTGTTTTGYDCSGWELEKIPDGGGVKLRPTTPGRRRSRHPSLRKLRKAISAREHEVPAVDDTAEFKRRVEGQGSDEEARVGAQKGYAPYPHPFLLVSSTPQRRPQKPPTHEDTTSLQEHN